MPFGCTASVHHWDRTGALLRRLARTFLKAPVSRYVDDFFAVGRPEDIGHALQCIARLIRALIGDDALANEKLDHGRHLNVLGLRFDAHADGVEVRVSDDKASKWRLDVERALATNTLSAWGASKLAGRLSFASQHIFRRLGRSMLRPLFRPAKAPLRGNRLGLKS